MKANNTRDMFSLTKNFIHRRQLVIILYFFYSIIIYICCWGNSCTASSSQPQNLGVGERWKGVRVVLR